MAKNYNYVILVYDIGEKRVGKVFKICKKYLVHFQKSVFRGEITPANLIQLRAELKKVIDEGNDFVAVFKMTGDYVFDEEIIGARMNDSESLLL
ncbi:MULTISPECIES: CRISPR-associated endonuclease Cas2 [Paenibacillus]|jgi:CRISPR-associated protein Cas2|uniref:CRISPR-associated endonuclease Cas2 n=1 Tax=Paenibacillus TaxID=44249 RepID=UPI00024F0244|nr:MULTISPECIES: CRISPR-associated endonuclease Cas2 [Paenibacillus]EHS58076.1 CRISPR-associated protein Cas2 [Paenibacillus sp. Aloe-11]MEC0180355.1 CRISPR-associated endonuclease Cas2 [Paenibacillus peoriae]UMY56125.1 CRISPR-associated endonuclease Cas2 [Paenibacillus peoriae]